MQSRRIYAGAANAGPVIRRARVVGNPEVGNQELPAVIRSDSQSRRLWDGVGELPGMLLPTHLLAPPMKGRCSSAMDETGVYRLRSQQISSAHSVQGAVENHFRRGYSRISLTVARGDEPMRSSRSEPDGRDDNCGENKGRGEAVLLALVSSRTVARRISPTRNSMAGGGLPKISAVTSGRQHQTGNGRRRKFLSGEC